MRTLVIGGGATGLTLADELSQAGHDVVLVEASARLGGKCECVLDDHGRVHDLGGVIGMPLAYREVEGLAARLGLHREWVPVSRIVDRQGRLFDPHAGARAKLRLAYQFCKYLVLHRRTGLRGGGLEAGSPELLGMTWRAWLERHHLGELERMTRVCSYGYGYGTPDEGPAAYALNSLGPPTMLGTLLGMVWTWSFSRGVGSGLLFWTEGMGTLWERLGEQLRARTDHPVMVHTGRLVTEVRPAGGRVRVRLADGEAIETDAVFVTCNPKDALRFLPTIDPRAARLFDGVVTDEYVTYLCRVEGLGRRGLAFKGAGYIYENCDAAHSGHPALWGNRYADDWFVFYVPVRGETPAMVDANLVAAVEALGGRLDPATGIRAVRRWRMFPRFPPSTAPEMFAMLPEIQGRNGIHFAGEAFSFSRLCSVVRHAREVAHAFARQSRSVVRAVA